MIARILVVDDNPEIRGFLRNYLESRDHQVFEAEDGAQAFAMAEKEMPHLIIMDIVMPDGVYGTSASKKLQSYWRTSTIPIIIMSGASGTPILEFLDNHPNIRFLQKPIDLALLERMIRELLPMGGYLP